MAKSGGKSDTTSDAGAGLPERFEAVFAWADPESKSKFPGMVMVNLRDDKVEITVRPEAPPGKRAIGKNFNTVHLPLEVASTLAQQLIALPPVQEAMGVSPLVMHFDSDADRDAFVQRLQQANPQMQVTPVGEPIEATAEAVMTNDAAPAAAEANIGTFQVTGELLDTCLGIPPGYAIVGGATVQAGVVQLAVMGEAVPASPDGNPVPLRFIIEEERGHGLLGGVIRRTKFEKDEPKP